MHAKNPNRFTEADLYVSRDTHPDWPTGAEQLPQIGDEVFCVEGVGRVVKVLGKTGDGSRLLELKLESDPKGKPYFAAASNVLVRPRIAA
jgi:hypothetical protein